eukprot:3698210-Ditylum_brightwellii.AAC.1
MCAASDLKQGVQFNPNVIIISFTNLPAASDMTVKEKKSAWYSTNEITTFRNNVREASRIIRQRNRSDNIVHRPQHENLSKRGECSRGLEHRISSERQANKCIAMCLIMECQRRHRRSAAAPTGTKADLESQLAIISSRLSQQAKDVALSAAREDFIA